jgi:hypothetical protein
MCYDALLTRNEIDLDEWSHKMSTDATYNGFVDALHNAAYSTTFRFYCDSSFAEKTLIDSLERARNEVFECFEDFPLVMSSNSEFDMTCYPMFKSSDRKVTVLGDFDMDVYDNGCMISADKNIPGQAEAIDEGYIKALYKEQFVLRLHLLIMDADFDLSTATEIFKSILINTDVPGVELISIEEQKATDNVQSFPLMDCIPALGEKHCHHPIYGLQDCVPEMLSFDELGIGGNEPPSPTLINKMLGTDDAAYLSCGIISFADNDMPAHSHKITCETDIGPMHFSLGTHYSFVDGKYGQKAKLLGINQEGKMIPSWLYEVKGRETIISRYLQIPLANDVESAFYTARSYPASQHFDERMGYQYPLLLASSKNETLTQLFDEGISVERTIKSDGYVTFELNLPLAEGAKVDIDGDDLIISLGSEVKAEKFFINLSKEELPVSIDTIIMLAEENYTDERDAFEQPGHPVH